MDVKNEINQTNKQTLFDTITFARQFTCFTVMTVSSNLWRKESRFRFHYTFNPYCLGHIKKWDSSIKHWLLHRLVSSWVNYPACTCTSAAVYRICGISYKYVYRAAVHILKAIKNSTGTSVVFPVNINFIHYVLVITSVPNVGERFTKTWAQLHSSAKKLLKND